MFHVEHRVGRKCGRAPVRRMLDRLLRAGFELRGGDGSSHNRCAPRVVSVGRRPRRTPDGVRLIGFHAPGLSRTVDMRASMIGEDPELCQPGLGGNVVPRTPEKIFRGRLPKHRRDLNPLLGGGVRTAQHKTGAISSNDNTVSGVRRVFRPTNLGFDQMRALGPARLRVWQFGRKIRTSCGCILKSLMCS